MKAFARAWSPVSLALSCVLACIALCLHADNILLFAFEKSSAAGPFACAFLGGAVTLCLAVAVSAHDDEQRRWSIGVGLASAGAGVGFALFLDALPALMTAVCSGALLGFGLTCLLRQWGRYYRSFTFQGSLFSTGLSFLLGSCWWFAMMHAGSPFLFCLGLLVLVLSGGLPLLASDIVRADEIRAGLRDVDENWVPSVTIWQVMRQGWAAVAGLMFNFFVIGLTFWPLASGLGAGIVPKPLPYLLVAIVAWQVASRVRDPAGGMLETFYRVGLPVAAAVMLTAPALAVLFPEANSLALSALSYLGIAVLNVLGLVVLFWSAKSSEVGFSKMFAAFCASCAASMALGMLTFQLLGSNVSRGVALVLLVAYLAAVLVGEAWRLSKRRREANAAACAPTAEAACDDELAEAFGSGD
ncbi:hypothetical protein [Gordonibacter sp. 28C]|uniref:hypothetical protein n=1 Tax=Gordonibacter sp. 28C TaxID=2078569 RepID=UPI0011C08350|nr:hypothetical protein [Gordonibacter sp. 28C]